ncbi:MAG TPA: transglycosylase family protein [Microthrixaceae bacterium]|nr:transglycosylase family protein [Microthrixaceae bacterium]
MKIRSISTRACAAVAVGLGILLLGACSPEQQAIVGAAIDSQRSEANHIAARTAGGPSDAVLARIRRCESGGNYRSVSRSGSYRGAYQFSQSTWNGVAKNFLPAFVSVDPAKAPPHIQDAMARLLYKRSGRSPWPHCGR